MKVRISPAPCTALILFASLLATSAQSATYLQSWNVGLTIPDDDAVGLANTQTVTGSGIDTISLVEVTLLLDGASAWNGDYYAYLHHGGGVTILLNRIGKTSSNSIGSGTVGMNVTFADGAATDVHQVTASSGTLVGTYQPDAREADPAVVTEASPRTAFLSNFQGMSADGDWTLFIADMSGGDQGQLVQWSLSITGTAVPEPSSSLLFAGSACLFFLRRRR